MTWQEKKPEQTDIPNAELASLLTGQKQTFRGYLEQHFYWTASSGVSAGIPLLSDGSFGPGSARAAYIPSSAQSATTAYPLKPGSFVITTDTNNLIGYSGSTTSILLNSQNALVPQASIATIPAGAKWLVQSGSVSSTTAGTTLIGTSVVTFSTPYNGTPVVLASAYGNTPPADFYLAGVQSITSVGFTASFNASAAGGNSTITVVWRSEGTVNF